MYISGDVVNDVTNIIHGGPASLHTDSKITTKVVPKGAQIVTSAMLFKSITFIISAAFVNIKEHC